LRGSYWASSINPKQCAAEVTIIFMNGGEMNEHEHELGAENDKERELTEEELLEEQYEALAKWHAEQSEAEPWAYCEMMDTLARFYGGE
jgi:hypothetical protein